MASSSSAPYLELLLLLLLCSSILFGGRVGASAPAMYVFGDSLVDVGNNDYLSFTYIKADFPHNGLDYPGKKATGRFSNGKNAADLLAEKLGLPSPPPYFSIITSEINEGVGYLKGVNFASGGAGILDSTNRHLCLTLNKQIEHYSIVYAVLGQQLGNVQAQSHAARSIFALIIGSNDIFSYIGSRPDDKLKTPVSVFVNSLVSTLQGQLQRLYNLGARKFAFIGTGPLGCCPSQRTKSKTQDCDEEANELAFQYGRAVASLLKKLKPKRDGMSYSFFDTFTALAEYIQNPTKYGFIEAKAACCGLGNLNGKVACLPISLYCANRTNHVFWDPNHPTETAVDLLATTAVDGSPPHVFPVNVRQLSAF